MNSRWSEKVEIGKGAYTITEAATYLHLNESRIRRWVFGAGNFDKIVNSELGDTGARVLSFLDLVQIRTINELRKRIKVESGETVALDLVRQAVRRAYATYSIDYPFARECELYYFDKAFIIRTKSSDGDFKVLAGKKDFHGQHVMNIVKNYLTDLRFNPVTGLASEMVIHRWNDYEVVLDPKVRFGEPRLRRDNQLLHMPWVLYEAIKSENGVAGAARAFGCEESEVFAAADFMDRSKGVAA